MHFSTNIRLLRTRRNLTQDAASQLLGMSRSTLNSYENGSVINPTIEALMNFSKYYSLSIDTLIRKDLSKISVEKLSELENGSDEFINGKKLRVVATTVDSHNRDNIEVVPLKAQAGYTNGYADADFIKALPVFQLPILYNDKKYRMFQIRGDSMLPIPEGSWVIAEYVDSWHDIKNGQAYIILTQDEGIVFKVAYNQIRKRKNLLLKSLNTAYEPYEVSVSNIREVWKFCNYISDQVPEAKGPIHEISSSIIKMEEEIKVLKKVMDMHI